jgi:lysozyme family protein
MTLDETLNFIIQNEGGYVNNPNDRGGPTNFGVTQATLSNYLGRQASIEEVRNMTVETAKEIFTRNYIVGPRIDSLPAPIVPVVADASVLYGPRRAIMFVQRVINSAGFGPIDVDGVIGPMTRDKAAQCYGNGTINQSAMGPMMINAIVYERNSFNERIVANDPTQQIFLQGWRNRANKFLVKV